MSRCVLAHSAIQPQSYVGSLSKKDHRTGTLELEKIQFGRRPFSVGVCVSPTCTIKKEDPNMKITEQQAIEIVAAAIAAIGKNTPEELEQAFTKDASFFMTRNPYRIDDLET